MSRPMNDCAASRTFRLVTIVVVVAATLAIPAQIQAASPTGTVGDVTMTAVSFSHAEQTSTGSMTLTIDGGTDGLGWNVTILASAFVYAGPNGGTSIPASSFALTSAAEPVTTSGDAVDPTGGPRVPVASPLGTLDGTRKIAQADAGFGKGTYTQALGVSLTIPGQSAVGTYTCTLSITASVGP